MEHRVLIVESQGDFALSIVSMLEQVGYFTSQAASAADALRELESNTPDLLVLRAELPDLNGFTLCETIRQAGFGVHLPIIVLSSEVGSEGFAQHAQSAAPANAYLAIPFEMGELTSLIANLLPSTPPSSFAGDDLDVNIDNALFGSQQQNEQMPSGIDAAVPPPPLRRDLLTEDDKAFLERTFGSVAERQAELLAENREMRRNPVRRELMGTLEGKIHMLRDELKTREIQIAHISELWPKSERARLVLEDCLAAKDVEIQGLKAQSHDSELRIDQLQNDLRKKEHEHGQQLEDLLLQKFIGEKEVIEVVSGKEKEANILRKEKRNLEDELIQRDAALDHARREYEQLNKECQLNTLEFELKEKELQAALQQHSEQAESQESNIEQLTNQLEQTTAQLKTLTEAEDKAKAELSNQLKSVEEDSTRRIQVLTHSLKSQKDINKQLEQKIKSFHEDSKHATGALTERLEALLAELNQAKQTIALKTEEVQKTSKELKRMEASLQQASMQFQEANAALIEEKTTGKQHSDALGKKFQAMLEERSKALETKYAAELEAQTAQYKTEMAHRDELRAQETNRLHEAIRAKSKQLKILELELARYKSKPTTPITRATPSPSPSPSPVPHPPPPSASAPSQNHLAAQPSKNDDDADFMSMIDTLGE